MPSGINRVTGLPFEANHFKSEYSIEDPELQVRISIDLCLVCVLQDKVSSFCYLNGLVIKQLAR